MPTAARIGDLTSHGSPLTPSVPPPAMGSPNVLIGGMPAWRTIADLHLCPVTSPQPHGAGAVLKGSTSVFINNLPAARQGDEIVEAAGGPNKITLGCFSVLIGG